MAGKEPLTKKHDDVLKAVAEYYSSRLAEHGQTAKGVDWNGEESQNLRFAQLTKIIDRTGRVSVNDLGCGYGGYFEYLRETGHDIDYNGFDLSKDMVSAARSRFAGVDSAHFLNADAPDSVADFGVASGIFNVKLDCGNEQWGAMILRTLDVMHATSRHGFAFNCLTSYSDADKMRDYLYYANPMDLFDHCKRHYSRNVALLHDYDLYEFTILVRTS